VLQDKAEYPVWEEARPDQEVRLVQGARPDWEARLVQETRPVQNAGPVQDACPVWEEVHPVWEGEIEASDQEMALVDKIHGLTTDNECDDEHEGTEEDAMHPDDVLRVGPAIALLEELRHEVLPEAPHAAVDNILDVLGDHPRLCIARDQLVLIRKDKKIDILFQAHIVLMVGCSTSSWTRS